MATGYDNRQEVRATRLTATAPRQYNPRGAASSPTGRSGVVGAGAATGGVVQSQNPTLNIGVGANIPGFLEKVFEPVLQERQTERMYQGMKAAMENRTMQDIQAEQPTLSGLFGATAFEQGASFQHARQGVAAWQNKQLENMEALKQLAPEEVSKVLFDGAKPFLTGDNATDSVIHKMVIEASETLIPVITRKRIEWRNDTMRNGMVQDATARAGTLASVMSMDSPDQAALASAVDGVRSAFVKPPQMPAETWVEAIEETARGYVANGNLHALQVITEGGSNSLLFQSLGAMGDGTKYAAILSLADTASKKAASEWASQPENAQRIDLLNAKVATREVRGSEIRSGRAATATSPAVDGWDQINRDMMAATGSLVPLRTPEQITADVEGYVNSVASEDRANQTRLATAQATRQEDLDKEANEISTIRMALSTMDPQEAIMAYGPTKVDNVARSIWQTDPQASVPMLSGIFRNRGIAFDGVAVDMQNLVEANTRAGADSEGFRKAYQVWSQFDNHQGGIETRARYFGKYDTTFMQYETLTSGAQKVPPLIAFQETFGQAGVAAGTIGPGERPRGTNAETISNAIGKYQPGWIGQVLGRQRITGVSKAVLDEWVAPEAATRMANRPGLTPENAVAGAVSGLLGSGKIDQAGAYYWETPSGGPSMASITGIGDAARLGNVLEDIIRDQTRTPTFAGITAESVRITPLNVPGQPTYWTVWGENRDGHFRGFTLTPDMIKGRDRTRMEEQRVTARNRNNSRPPEGVGDPGRLPRPLPNAPRGGLINVPAAPVQFTSPLFGGFRGN